MPSDMSMTSCNHMCCHSCNGSQEPSFNKTMLGLTRMSLDFLRTVTTLPWSARSLDVSLIEHIWNHMGQQVGHPSNLNELEQRFSNCGDHPLEGRDNSTRGREHIEKSRTKDYLKKLSIY
ncbi:uncharacterized protein TNCV_4306511 [Trichonephila clavipes]|nr:uncharacterized protein TNCV_4306511 [Trichonephila clavipes]